MADTPTKDSGLYDLLFLTDATGSMTTYLDALRQCLPDIIRVSALTDCFSRIGVLAYRDYDRSTKSTESLVEWSGWHALGDPGLSDISQAQLLFFTRQLEAFLGGGAEAAKSGLAKAHSVMRPEATTIIVFFADQPPHLPWLTSTELFLEREHLSQPDSFDGSGPLFLDWVSAVRTLQSGDRKARVFAYVDTDRTSQTLSAYLYLCKMTGGACFRRTGPMRKEFISDVVVSMLLSWMGLAKKSTHGPDPGADRHVCATFYDWKDPSTVALVENEDDVRFQHFFGQRAGMYDNFVSAGLRTVDQIGFFVSRREPPLQDLSDRYTADPAYRVLVVTQLRFIIDTDVCAIATNPVFGTLWRTVTRDRNNPARPSLIAGFGQQVERFSDASDRARMAAWLGESYDNTSAVTEMLNLVSDDDRFPCVYLDPTQDFCGAPGDLAAGPSVGHGSLKQPDLTKFSRAELLEISRSCDPKILRRLGKVLTRLSFASSEDSLPAHIRSGDVPRIPMALALERYDRQFWKILLHLILPGTSLSARPAALLAALSNRMGVLPLRAAADEELLAYNSYWASLETPETWNTSCLSLLLDADREYEKRVTEGITTRHAANSCVLRSQDRRLFQTLVDYKMLEINLDTTLATRIGWTPSKTREAMGPVVVCIRCHRPRSVTVMGPGQICGVCQGMSGCICDSCTGAPNFSCDKNVSGTHDESTKMVWVECSSSDCRSQYIVYNHKRLNVPPKCFYCRHRIETGAPFVECTQCLNRVIWPLEYRPSGIDLSEYRCTSCAAGRTTVISHETSAKKLSAENGFGWLVRDDGDGTIKELFRGRSIYNAVISSDLQAIATNVTVLPSDPSLQLTVGGKAVRNVHEVVASLAGWVARRQAELGTCSLCFSDLRKPDLVSACGRRGCLSRVCGACRDSWYGLNAPGRLINLAALCCPFCRRRPSPGSVSRELASLGGLREAVDDPAWIYAWCADCGFARQHTERVCANGAPPELGNWTCEPCGQRRRRRRDWYQRTQEYERPSNNPDDKVETRECPGCGVATEKSSGCNHITCTCGTHWCYQCGAASTFGDIYQHMSEVHGGFYGGTGYEEDEVEDDWEYGGR